MLVSIVGSQALAQQTATQNIETRPARAWNFGMGVGHTAEGKAEYTDMKWGKDITGTGESEFSGAPIIQFDIRRTPEDSWGFIGALTYDFERKMDSIKARARYKGFTADMKSTDTGMGIQTTSLEANAVYRWDRAYLPFGMNVSKHEFSVRSGTSPTVDGLLGAQLGFGFYATENVVVEIWSRAIGYRIHISDVDYGPAYLGAMQLNTKFLF